jgi:hypothetical protein
MVTLCPDFGSAMKHFPRVFIATIAAASTVVLWAADEPAVRHASLTPAKQDAQTAGTDAMAAFGQPVLGYVMQSPPLLLRAILGVPGAASFSAPLSLPAEVIQLHIAPSQAYALAERRANDLAVIPLKAGRAGQAVAVPGAMPSPDLVAFSFTGRSAVLYSAVAAQLQVVAGLPGAPTVVETISTGTLAGGIQDAAVSDDGTSVLIASAGGAYQLLHGAAQQVVSATVTPALAFFPNSSQAAIGDRSTGSVYLWPAGAGSAAASLLTAHLEGMAAMCATADGQGLWVTNPAGSSIWWVSAQTGEVRTLPLPVRPTSMERLPYRDMLLISSEVNQPAWIFFQQGGEALTVFVPAAGIRVHPGNPGRVHVQ